MINKLNIEVLLVPSIVLHRDALGQKIKEELHGQTYRFGEVITSFKSEELLRSVKNIRICELERSYKTDDVQNTKEECWQIDGNALKIFFYCLNEDESQPEMIAGGDDTLAANYSSLPSKFIDGLWEVLIYDSNIKEDLLQYSRAMLHYSKCNIDSNIVACNRVLLLHGPPGTGKTSLCKALSQKLAIRLSASFHQSLLIEINTHSLFSKYFSESGKLVSKMFEKIREIASDPQTLVCVLIDEVESLTHSRAAASTKAEPSDALRVVNAVLTHLDILKSYPNVLILSTSNITEAIDIAFVDRADLKIYIPNPSPFGIYSILYSCIEELVKKGIVLGPCPVKILDRHKFCNSPLEQGPEENEKLITLANECSGLSGRALRKLPLRVHSTLILPDETCTLINFLKALSLSVKNHRMEMNNFKTHT